MTVNEKILILEKAAIAFRQKPESQLYNTSGLCLYLKSVFGLDHEEIIEILGDKYQSYFTFGAGFAQDYIYTRQLEDYKFERVEWCENEVKRLKKIDYCESKVKVVCPECLKKVSQNELNMFKGFCEECKGTFGVWLKNLNLIKM